MKRVGILTYHRACNYGAVLQAYALQTAIARLSPDVDVKVIDYRTPAIEDVYDPRNMHSARNPLLDAALWLLRHGRRERSRRDFDAFLDGHVAMTAPVRRQDLDGIAADFDAIVTGSDQVWNTSISHGDGAFFLDFLDGFDGVSRISYGASFGGLKVGDTGRAYFSKRLEKDRWNAMSVREPSAADLVQELAGHRPSVVLDPTLLLAPKDWSDISLPLSRLEGRGDFVLIYNQVPPKRLLESAGCLAKRLGCPLYHLGGGLKHPGIPNLTGVLLEQFLWLFMNARFTVVNSFHGAAFSIAMHRPFLVETVDARGSVNTRIQGLLDACGIVGRDISAPGFSLEDALSPIDWEQVDARLSNRREESLAFLKEAVLA